MVKEKHGRDHSWACGVCNGRTANQNETQLNYACAAEEALRVLREWVVARMRKDPLEIERNSIKLHECAINLIRIQHKDLM